MFNMSVGHITYEHVTYEWDMSYISGTCHTESKLNQRSSKASLSTSSPLSSVFSRYITYAHVYMYMHIYTRIYKCIHMYQICIGICGRRPQYTTCDVTIHVKSYVTYTCAYTHVYIYITYIFVSTEGILNMPRVT